MQKNGALSTTLQLTLQLTFNNKSCNNFELPLPITTFIRTIFFYFSLFAKWSMFKRNHDLVFFGLPSNQFLWLSFLGILWINMTLTCAQDFFHCMQWFNTSTMLVVLLGTSVCWLLNRNSVPLFLCDKPFQGGIH